MQGADQSRRPGRYAIEVAPGETILSRLVKEVFWHPQGKSIFNVPKAMQVGLDTVHLPPRPRNQGDFRINSGGTPIWRCTIGVTSSLPGYLSLGLGSSSIGFMEQMTQLRRKGLSYHAIAKEVKLSSRTHAFVAKGSARLEEGDEVRLTLAGARALTAEGNGAEVLVWESDRVFEG